MKKCKECGREEWGFLSVLNDDGFCPVCASIKNKEKISKLQEQLKEANKIIKDFHKMHEFNKSIIEYFKK